MKLESPPDFAYYYQSEYDSFIEHLLKGKSEDFLQEVNSKYLYWNEFKYRKDLPFPEDPTKSWKLVKVRRRVNYHVLKLCNHQFYYYLTLYLHQQLHELDLNMPVISDKLREYTYTPEEIANYSRNSFSEEAIASSQIEGNVIIANVARSALDKSRTPGNESERMVENNLRAMDYIKENISRDIEKSFIVELHEIITKDTTAALYSGDYRKGEVSVVDPIYRGEAHYPPPKEDVEPLMNFFCDFINSSRFTHPVVKASIIHFLVGYIHPFMDGNGRTARALFYWYLLKKNYKLINHVSISKFIKETKTEYAKAFLRTERDENDLTYFIIYSIKILRRAFEETLNDLKIKVK